MKVKELMTKDVQACSNGATLNDAARIMWEHDCGVVPVLAGDSSDRVTGVITDRDICMAAYSQGKPLCDIPVTSAMAQELCCCTPETPVQEAESLMSDAQVRRLVVVNEDGRLAGILAMADIARTASRPAAKGRGGPDLADLGDTLACISKPTNGATQVPA
jgi:CBS domain-containing protein